MLFYSTLFITSFIVVILVLWFFRMVATFARQIRRTHLQGPEQGPTAHLREQKYGKDLKLASKAWSGKSRATPANLARTHPAKPAQPTPWGWPGNECEIRERRPKVAMTNGATPNSNLKATPNSNLKATPNSNLKREKVRCWKQNTGLDVFNHRPDLGGQAYTPSEDARTAFSIDKKK